jgi:hypothetical protein
MSYRKRKKNEKKISKIGEDNGKIRYHKEWSVEDGVGHTPPRIRRRSSRGQEWASGQPVESTSRVEEGKVK